MQAVTKLGIYRIIDANSNRAKEGLRVCEEITRFVLNDPRLTNVLKSQRHAVEAITKTLPKAMAHCIRGRDSAKDVGRAAHKLEFSRSNINDIFFANIQRAQEALRVLEEFSKLIDIKKASRYKKIRYAIYEIEKAVAQKLFRLRHP